MIGNFAIGYMIGSILAMAIYVVVTLIRER